MEKPVLDSVYFKSDTIYTEIQYRYATEYTEFHVLPAWVPVACGDLHMDYSLSYNRNIWDDYGDNAVSIIFCYSYNYVMEPNFSNPGALCRTCSAGKSMFLFACFTTLSVWRHHNVDDRMINECEAVGRVRIGRGKRSSHGETAPVPCPCCCRPQLASAFNHLTRASN
jgi:hypothetical protein